MRRAERLAEIVEIVRDGRLHTARELAATLDVTERTVYRDMDTLAASGVPIEGERGVGYLLREPVFLPPLALSLAELEALSLGMAIVGETADRELGAAARSLLDKVEGHAAVRRRSPEAWGFGIYEFALARAGLTPMPLLRRAIRERLTLAITEPLQVCRRLVGLSITLRSSWPQVDCNRRPPPRRAGCCRLFGADVGC